MTHGGAAKSVRLAKERHPEDYCAARGCLWNTRRSGPCKKHSGERPLSVDAQDAGVVANTKA